MQKLWEFLAMSNCITCAYGKRPEYDNNYDVCTQWHRVEKSYFLIRDGRYLYQSIEEILNNEKYNDLGKKILLIGRIQHLFMNDEMFCVGCSHAMKAVMNKHYQNIKNDNDLEIVYTDFIQKRLEKNIKNKKMLDKLNNRGINAGRPLQQVHC